MSVHLFMCFLCVCSWALSCVCLAELRDCRVLPAAQTQQEGSAPFLDLQEDATEALLCGGGSCTVSRLLGSALRQGKAKGTAEPWDHSSGCYEAGLKCHFSVYKSRSLLNHVNVLLILRWKEEMLVAVFIWWNISPLFNCLLLWGSNRIIQNVYQKM